MDANGNSRGDTKDWPQKATLAFLHILNEKTKQIGECSFKSSVWREIDRELHAQSGGETYGVDCLKSKLNRLRVVYREFSKVLEHTGVSWDPNKNTITALEEVWQGFKVRKFNI